MNELKCDMGYFLDSIDKKCTPCFSFDINCELCNEPNVCLKCSQSSFIYQKDNLFFCKKCERGFYPKNFICKPCSDFGRCQDCNYNECISCLPNSNINSNKFCVCSNGFFSVGVSCYAFSSLVIPFLILGILITIGCFYIYKRQNREHTLIELNSIRSINPDNSNNINSMRICVDNKILNPLKKKDDKHGIKCIYGDNSPPYWQFDCGGYMCNDCSLKLVTNFSKDKSLCLKCNKYANFFKFVDRNVHEHEANESHTTHIIKIESIRSENINASRESMSDSVCKICFSMKNSMEIKCDSPTPHMMCDYCYCRLINIEDTQNCPFCRTLIH